jgi:xanthine dehydrogenase accessory factor
MNKPKVLIKGAGDLATGVAHTLHTTGFGVLLTEISRPTAIRRQVAFAQAVYDGTMKVEGVKAILVTNIAAAIKEIEQGNIAVLADEQLVCLTKYAPEILIDATLAKKNTGLSRNMAPLVIALGPGFIAGEDADVVIETMRGHDLGRLIYAGSAAPDTGTPGEVGGKTTERLLRASASGKFRALKQIGDYVQTGKIVATCGNQPVYAQIEGFLRGILMDELQVSQGMKVGDIDPRCKYEHCFTISDKARALGGAVLTAIYNSQFIIHN